jgi:tetratricopeptide (TPR) repeat protein
MDAEHAYLFRHATLRDAAYQLLPPSQRSRLHALALDILEETTLGLSLDHVLDMAEHAGHAQSGVTTAASDLPFRELRYLRLAAVNAAGKYQNLLAAQLWERVARHPAAEPRERVEALAEAGLMHWMLGRRAPALACYSRGIELADTPAQQAFLLIERGCLYRDVRENSSALRDLEGALEHARTAGDKDLQLRALGNFCTVQDEGMTQAGVSELYAPVLKLARETGNLRAVGITEGQIAMACMRGENWQDARKHFEEAVHLLREAGDSLNEATMLSATGTLWRTRTDGDRRHNLMQAIRYHRDALALKQRSGFLFQKAEPLIGLADANRELGMLHEAERWAREALQVAREVGDPEATGRAFLQLGQIQQAAGDPDTAERTLTYGFLAVEDARTEQVKIGLLSALARLLASQGAWDDARSHAANAVTLAEALADTRERTRARQLLRCIEERRLDG